MKWMCGEEPAWLMSRLANEQAGQQLFSCTASLTILTRSSPWNGRGALNFVNDTANFYRSPECSSLSLLLCLLPKVVGSASVTSASSLCALGAAGLLQQLPACPVELWTCISPLRQTHPKAPSHHTPRMGTADSGLLLHSLIRGRDFSFKFCFWTCAFLAWFNEYCRLWNGENQNNTLSPTGKKGLLSWE